MLSLPNLILKVQFLFRNLDVNKHKTPPILNIKTGEAKAKFEEKKSILTMIPLYVYP